MFKKNRFIISLSVMLLLSSGMFYTVNAAEEVQENGWENNDSYVHIEHDHLADLKKLFNFFGIPFTYHVNGDDDSSTNEDMNETDKPQVEESDKDDENIDQPNPEQPRPEQPRPEQPRPEQPRPEQPRPEQPNEERPTNPSPEETESQLNAYEREVVELTNIERAQHGLAPFEVDVNLSKVAREKSRDMAVNHYFDHNSPVYGSPFDMMQSFGITYRTAGENIAKGQRSPSEVVNAWMNSPGHRANILNSNFTHIGVGYVANGNVWTQQFIGK